MEERMQMDDGFNLVDLIKILLNKIKILILVVICGGLAGAGFAIWRTIDVNYYGTTVEFYINPESRDAEDGTENISQYGIYGAYSVPVMDAMVRLLNSDAFTERLMLKGAHLPEKGVWTSEKEETDLGLNALIDTAQSKLNDAAVAKENANAKRAQAEADLKVLQAEWKEFVAGSRYANTAYSVAAYNAAIYDSELQSRPADDLNTAFAVYEGESGSKELSIAAINAAKDANAEALAARESVLAAWAKTAKYKQALNKYSSAVKFSYLEDENVSTESTNLARSFVYVKITILNDEAFAKELLQTIKLVVPTYIEERMVVPTGYDSTNCQRITRNDEIAMTNPGYTRNQAFIYGLAGAAFAGLVACVIVIIVDRSNKCLRNYEIIPKNFNVPILGVIPTIEDMLPTNDKNAEVKQ